MSAPEFDKKHLKKAGGHIGRNFVNITINMKTIVRKHGMIKKNTFQNYIHFPVQNGSSSVQNGNSSVQNGKIIISINIKNILLIILAIKLLTFYNIKNILHVIY